jgi:flavin reductase (DIM6/NTAB) family NADH-FMN oxidoreductase RutF
VPTRFFAAYLATNFLNMKHTVKLEHASRLINHGPTVLVSTLHNGKRNVMAAAWSMPVEFDPPRLAVVIDKSTLTREHIAATGLLALSVPCRAMTDATFAVGSVSGRDAPKGQDKFEQFNLPSFTGPELGLPLVEGCVAWLECRVLQEPHTQQTYDTFFVEVVSAQADARVFANGRWQFTDANAELHTLHHLGAGVFAVASDTVQAYKL